MKLKVERELDAIAIAAALSIRYPSYRFEPKRWPQAKRWSIAVYCKSTGALLLTTAQM